MEPEAWEKFEAQLLAPPPDVDTAAPEIAARDAAAVEAFITGEAEG